MRLLCALAMLAGIFEGAAQSQERIEIRVGPNILVDREHDGNSGELHLASDPTNPLNLFGTGILFSTTNLYGRQETRGYLSRDGGNTWRTITFPEASMLVGGDPQVAYGKTGTAYFLTISSANPMKLYFYRSEDGGASWEKPIELDFIDHPQIVVDHTSGPLAGHIYITGLTLDDDGPQDYHITVMHSSDDGRSWSGPRVLATNHKMPGRGLNVANPIVFRDGEVFIPYRDFRITGDIRKTSSYWFVTSKDAGKTFSLPRKFTVRDGGEVVGPFNIFPFFSVDHTNGRFIDRVYAVWEDRDYFATGIYADGVKDGKRSRLLFSSSSDRGRTWSEPKMVAPGRPDVGDQFGPPSVAVNKEGVVAVTWFDTVDTPASYKGTLSNRYVAASVDGGQTFSSPRILSSAACDYNKGMLNPGGGLVAAESSIILLRAAGYSRGDYLSLVADSDGTFHDFWNDCRTGRNQIWTAPVVIDHGGGGITTKELVDADVTGFVDVVVDPLLEYPPVGTVELPIRLKNRSDYLIFGPMNVEVIPRPGAPTPTLSILNSENGKTGIGARFDYTRALGDFKYLRATALSEAVVWRMKAPPTRQDFGSLKFKVTARIEKPGLQIIKSTKPMVTLRIGDALFDDGWLLDPRRIPDVLEVSLVNGGRQKVSFITDLDSIEFTVEEGKSYDFVIQKDDAYYLTKIVGKRVIPSLISSRVGSDLDARPKLHGPALSLEGGGLLSDGGLQRTIDLVRGCADCDARVDVVELTADRRQSVWQSISGMNGVNSVETIIVSSREAANLDEVVNAVSKAEVIFFDGGEQCNYVKTMKGTRLADVVKDLYRRGGGVGGTSAGLAILGGNIYDACNGSVTSSDALADPYHQKISFTYDFLNWPEMADIITDTHLVKRDRMGRTLAFVARQLNDRKARKALSIALDEGSGVVVDKQGLTTVFGPTKTYFIVGDHAADVCERGKPLTYSSFKVWKVSAGQTFNLRKWPKNGYYTVSVNQGKLSRDPY